jgi:hypothetical protein
VKALSLRQPWAWLVAAGLKDVENRTRWTNYRGRFYIHASKSSEIKVQGLGDQWIIQRLSGGNLTRYWNARLDRGAIIGEATLVNCRFRAQDEDPDRFSNWHEAGLYGYILEDAKLYDEPIPCKGTIFPLFFEPNIEKGVKYA